MTDKQIRDEVHRNVLNAIVTLSTEQFIYFMRELSEWCTYQADQKEFDAEMLEEFYNEEKTNFYKPLKQ